MYQTSDDADMRFVLDGTLAGGYLEKPSEFSLFMSTTYGKFLKFFYLLNQNFFWYDFFTYLFVCVSIFVITLSCCYDFEKTSVFKKICALITISLVGATAFVSPQFTITSGLLAISGVLSFYMLTENFFDGRKQKILCASYCIFALFFSSIIRFENCMIVSLFTGIALLPLWPYHDWKGIIKKSVIVVIALVFIATGWKIDYVLVNNNPEWKSLRQANIARVEITDKTEMWDNIENPWKGVEDKIETLSQNGYTFSKGDYRLLLSFLHFGNKPAFATDNLIKASKELAAKVQTVNSIRSGFRIKDYRHVFPSFLMLFMLLSVFFSKSYKKSLFVIISFFLLVVVLNCFFRALPYRLWFNFAFSVLTALLLLLRKDISFKGYKNTLSSLFLSALMLYSYTITHNQAISTRYQYKVFSKIKRDLKFLSADNIYVILYSSAEYVSAPFVENIFYKKKLTNYRQISISANLMMKNQLFSETDTWLDICSPDSKVRFLSYDHPLTDIKKAVTYFIKEKYNKRVVWFTKQPEINLFTYQCRILTDDEDVLRTEFQKEITGYENQERGPAMLEFFKYYFFARMPGKLSYKEFSEKVNLLDAEEIKE